MENPEGSSRTLLGSGTGARDPERAEPRARGPTSRSRLRNCLSSSAVCVFIGFVSIVVGTIVGCGIAYVVMSAAANGVIKRDVTPTNPSVLVHGFPVPVLANHTGNRTSVVQVRGMHLEDDEGAEAEQLDAESAVVSAEAADVELEFEAADAREASEAKAGSANAKTAAAQELPTMAPLTIVEVYEPQTRTATISYWPDMAEPASVMIQTARPSPSTIKLRPGTGNMQPWWHRPQVTRKILSKPKAKATAAAANATAQQATTTTATTTGTQAVGAKQTSAAAATSVHRDMWGTPVSSVTAFTQEATPQTTSVFYSVSRLGHGHGRGRVPVKLPTAVPAAKNTTAAGSVAKPAVAAAGNAPTAALDRSAAGFRKGNHTWDVVTSLDDPRARGRMVVTYAKDERILKDWAARGVDFVDGRAAATHSHALAHPPSTAAATVVGRPAMVLADGTVVVHPRPAGNETAGAFKEAVAGRRGPSLANVAGSARLNVSGPGPVVASGGRVLLANGTRGSGTRVQVGNVTRAAASVAAAHQSGEITFVAV
ncbi:hypothetical protein RB595_008403 [Gaeumannomyces hyphopodioides]